MSKDNKIEKWLSTRKEKKREFNAEILYKNLIKGDRVALGRAITLIESTNGQDRFEARKLIKLCLRHKSNSKRIGITGVPGVGKSTFIECFGSMLVNQGYKIAVLAVDPSSSLSGGSIMGDKTRMEKLSNNDHVFIRPSPTGMNLGGVAKNTRETITLCEAAGYDLILIETVGVGQSETVVQSMVDLFILLHLAGAGDELQGVKRGIMELADIIAITKVDGDNKQLAKTAKVNLSNALHLFPPKDNHWIPKVLLTSSIENLGIDELWDSVMKYFDSIMNQGWFNENRNNQELMVLDEHLKRLSSNYFQNSFEDFDKTEQEYKQMILDGHISGTNAAEEIYEMYKNKKREF
jgi:LAO/AO transport system kinase